MPNHSQPNEQFSASEISPAEYSRLFDNFAHAFCKVGFSHLNSDKADNLRFVVSGRPGHSPLAGIIFGVRNGMLLSPFSAPFGGLTFRGSSSPRFSELVSICDSLVSYARHERMPIRIVPAPPPYSPDTQPKMLKAMLCAGFSISCTDLNFHIPLSEGMDAYEKSLRRNGRRNLAMARDAGLTMLPCSIDRAYEVVRANRLHRGWPLHMSLDQVQDTASVITIDPFVVTSPLSGADVAAAIVYHVAPGIAQVVYWGDAPGHNQLRPVNFLAAALAAHYHKLDFKLLDIGISTVDGTPNYGLCDFKESVGCQASIKPIMTLNV